MTNKDEIATTSSPRGLAVWLQRLLGSWQLGQTGNQVFALGSRCKYNLADPMSTASTRVSVQSKETERAISDCQRDDIAQGYTHWTVFAACS